MKANPSTGNTSSAIVALPADDDPVHALGPEPSHVTVAYLGKADQNDPAVLSKAVADVAGRHQPFTEKVTGKAAFGADGAHVLHLGGDGITPVREELLAHPDVAQAHANADQFPNYVPHMTIGYPDDGDSLDALPTPNDVTFDRLALWHGDQRIEHPLGGKAMTASVSQLDEPPDEIEPPDMIPWYGVWAVEGKASGDKRTFAQGSLRNRHLPLPLTWQKAAAPAHQGEVKVGGAVRMARVTNPDTGLGEIRAGGWLLQNAEADEVVGEMAAFGRVGCSIGIDWGTFEIDPTVRGPFGGAVTFTDACVHSCALVITGAFEDSWISLGDAPEGFFGDDQPQALVASADFTAAELQSLAVSNAPWDGSAARFTPEQWKASCILHVCDGMEKSCHKLPIREPGGALSRAGVHAAAARFNQVQASPEAKASAKRALSAAYSQLGETPPDVLTSALNDLYGGRGAYVTMSVLDEDGQLLEFRRGPGWVTDPIPTARIHSYWTTPGKPGYAKIAWGTGGDFNRCRAEVGKYLIKSGDARFVNQTCAQWHKDALGYYPSTHAKMLGKHGLEPVVPSLSLVAAAQGGRWQPKLEWFADPGLTEPTLLQFEDHPEGTRVFGHLAEWDRCHLDWPGSCVAPPNLNDGGANFMLHRVVTDGGVIATGHITVGGGHADGSLDIVSARAHYGDVSTVFCDVVVGSDDVGIWFSGWLRPDHDNEEDRYKLFAAQLSGDWREVGADGLCLTAAHAVVSPGFPIKPVVHVEDARTTALVAAGGLPPRSEPHPIDASTLDQVVAAGIEAYEKRRNDQARLLGAAESVGATPRARLERVRASIEE